MDDMSGTTPTPPKPEKEYAQQGQPSSYQQSYGYSYNQPPYAPAAVEKKSHNLRTFLLAFAGAALACIIAFGAFGVWQTTADIASSNDNQPAQLGSSASTSIDIQGEDVTLPEAVASKALPSVAAIDVYVNQATLQGWRGHGAGKGSGSALTQFSLGSGVVLTKDGYIVTNYHVVEGGDAFKVTIAGETYDAEIVGSDPSSDLAVIKAQSASNLTPIEIGNSDDLIIGEWVMSIGSPFGLEQSVATGIVSATSRSQIMDSPADPFGNTTGEVTIYPNMIQTDAAINPGNSGGALVDSNGKLIGINTLITSYSGNYSGVGFAIPVNYAVNIAQQIIDGKTPTHAQLGVSLTTVNAQMAKRYGLSADSGAYIASVSSASGADEAGLQPGDIVTKIDGKKVESASDLMLAIRSKNPGDRISLEINRSGKTSEVEVTLGSDESSQTVPLQQNSSSSRKSILDYLFNGPNDGKKDAA